MKNKNLCIALSVIFALGAITCLVFFMMLVYDLLNGASAVERVGEIVGLCIGFVACSLLLGVFSSFVKTKKEIQEELESAQDQSNDEIE